MFNSEKFEELFSKYHSETKNRLNETAERLDEIELQLGRAPILGLGSGDAATREARHASAAFQAFARGGEERLTPEYKAALITSDDTSGGYLAPGEFRRELVRNLTQYSPVRSVARNSTTSAGSVMIPVRTAALTASWVGERETRSASTPTFGLKTVPLGCLAVYSDVSLYSLQDSAFDVEAELTQDFAEAFGAAEGLAMISGDGSKSRPEGILQTDGISSVNSGHATTLTYDGLVNWVFNLPSFYRSRATILANNSTYAVLMKLKSGDGMPLWQPSMAAGKPNTIFGIPCVEAPDMPDIAASSYPMIIGDFSHYRVYTKADGLTILRDPYSQATTGMVRFHAHMRVGATCVMAEAFRKLRIAA